MSYDYEGINDVINTKQQTSVDPPRQAEVKKIIENKPIVNPNEYKKPTSFKDVLKE